MKRGKKEQNNESQNGKREEHGKERLGEKGRGSEIHREIQKSERWK